MATYFADLPPADCFAEDPVARDEGNAYRGRIAIRFAVERRGEKWTVSGRVSGNFPGSPMSRDQIVELEIS